MLKKIKEWLSEKRIKKAVALIMSDPPVTSRLIEIPFPKLTQEERREAANRLYNNGIGCITRFRSDSLYVYNIEAAEADIKYEEENFPAFKEYLKQRGICHYTDKQLKDIVNGYYPTVSHECDLYRDYLASGFRLKKSTGA